jgi:hypothetical protein
MVGEEGIEKLYRSVKRSVNCMNIKTHKSDLDSLNLLIFGSIPLNKKTIGPRSHIITIFFMDIH